MLIKLDWTSYALAILVLAGITLSQRPNIGNLKFKNIINPDIPEINIDRDAIDDYIEKAIACKNIPALSISIVQLDEADNIRVTYANAYGKRDPMNADPDRPTTSTRFGVGSVSKQFTAGLLGTILTENGREGRFADIPLRELLPGQQWKLFGNASLDNTLTLRDLLSHRTGIHRYDFGWVFGLEKSFNDVCKNIHYLPPDQPLSTSFRSTFEYNNWMFTLAGYIATLQYAKSHPSEDAKTFEELIQQYIYDPLSMHDATFLEPGYDPKDFAVAGWYANGKWNPNFAAYNREIVKLLAPAGAISASADDMTQYMKHLLTRSKDTPGSVPRKVLYQQWETSNSVPPAGDIFAPFLPLNYEMPNYGLGWFLAQYRDYRLFTHEGDIGEYTTYLGLLPDLKAGIFISTTHSILDGLGSIYPRFIAMQVMDILTNHSDPWLPIDDFCLPDLDGLVQTNPVNTTGYKNNCTIERTPVVDSYVGIYDHPLFGEIAIDYDKTNSHLLIRNGLFGDGFLCENPLNTGHNSYRYVVDPSGPVFYLDIPSVNIQTRMNITLTSQFGSALVWWVEATEPEPVLFNKVSSDSGIPHDKFWKLNVTQLAEVEKLNI